MPNQEPPNQQPPDQNASDQSTSKGTSNLVEVALAEGATAESVVAVFSEQKFAGITLDEDYEPIVMAAQDDQHKETCLVRVIGTEDALQVLHEHMEIVAVWKDTPIAGFEDQNGGF